MKRHTDPPDWLSIAGDRESLAVEMEPPEALEQRTVDRLLERKLITRDAQKGRPYTGWHAVRASFAAAACIGLVALGVLIGRMTDGTHVSPGVLTGAETDLYALLLYETDDYDRAEGAEALARFSEYSEWIATAREREQFVTGEDLEAHRGWLLVPTESGIDVSEYASIPQSAPLSGILFVRATSSSDAIDLAKNLPHLEHGGSVIVQKTIRTDIPPPVQ